MSRILITGATGLLGGTLTPILKSRNQKVITHGNFKPADVNADMTNAFEVLKMLDATKPDFIINLVALSNVDKCEENPDLAYKMNVLPVENIHKWISENSKTRFLHISTDHLYDNPETNSESDVVFRNTYALSKYTSERSALLIKNSLVLRVNFFGKSHTVGRKSFSDSLIEAFNEGREMTLFTNVLFSPLSMTTLSEMIYISLNTNITGVFNVGSREGMSKRNFAHALAKRLKISASCARDGLSSDVNLLARRPTGMLMDVSKFETTFNVTLPTLSHEIETSEI